MMDEGKITNQGSYKELCKKKEFTDLMDLNKLNKNLKADEKKKSTMPKFMSQMSKTKSMLEGNSESFGV